jgi:PIN domain nuclease of toxin-antitoxin system
VRLLLDTHIFLWWIGDDLRLSKRAAALIADGANQVHVSAASAWEIVIIETLGAC